MNALKRTTRLLLCSAGLVAAALLAACGSGDNGRDPVLGLPAATLTSLAVTPATASISRGAGQQLLATATYNDGTSRDVTSAAAWTSATPGVASVNASSGAAVGAAVGSVAISAAYGGKSASATLTVTPATLVAMSITPATPSIAVGATQQFIATGTFSDNSSSDITAVSSFASATPGVASVAASGGLARGVTSGTTLITASSGALSASTTLSVTPAVLLSLAIAPQNPTLRIAATRQLAAIASYSDGTTRDVSASAAFVSATPASATSSSAGLLTGASAGTSVISASFQGQSASTTATVVNVAIATLTVTPASASVAVGATQQFIARATYVDGSSAFVTNSALWTSSSTANATVLAGGAATGVAVGSANISASVGALSGSAVLTVTATPTAPVVVVTPVNLGSANNFAVLAGTALTSASGGTTLITGDVGSPSQTVPPTQAAGYNNYASGAVLNTALADLQVAITDANSRVCDVTFAGDIDLGGLTLPPGVYCYAGSISITGTLSLNGSGVYIFRTALTLNSTANATVALLNGADAENITWVPTGATTLGANSVFKGSVLGQSAAITVGSNATILNGRVLSGAAVTLSNNQITK